MRLTSTSARPFLARLLLLGGLAFLGLYVYGLVMSAFDPLEIVGFTVLAVGVIAAYAVHVFRLKRLMQDPQQRHELTRELARQRERRGF
jgi:hypothetical protein